VQINETTSMDTPIAYFRSSSAWSRTNVDVSVALVGELVRESVASTTPAVTMPTET
jgi:hypothetical protein